MANYYATARSNYFAVRDEEKFRDWARLLGLEILEPVHHDTVVDRVRRYGITPGNGDDSRGWPNSLYHEETDEYEYVEVAGQLAVHLAEDEVAVLVEVGNEKLTYLSGAAVAVNSRGEIAHLDLDTIYEAASRLGPNITRAED